MIKKSILVFSIMAVLTSGFVLADKNISQDAILESTVSIYDSSTTIYIDDEIVELDVDDKSIESVEMIPLRHVLEKLGYDITWHEDERSVEISQGVQWTKIYIDENAYTKNKMAPMTLSAPPIIIDGRTLVPVEFFHEILGIAFEYENNDLIFNSNLEEMLATRSGYVVKVEAGEHESKIHLSNEVGGEVSLIVTTKIAGTITQKPIKVGEKIHVITYPITIMIYPGQVQGIVIY